MTADRKPPTGPPPSAGVLARHAQAYARELGVAEGRVRTWVSYMILAGVLERATDAGIEALVLSPEMEDFNEDLRHFGLDALRREIADQLIRTDRLRYLKRAA